MADEGAMLLATFRQVPMPTAFDDALRVWASWTCGASFRHFVTLSASVRSRSLLEVARAAHQRSRGLALCSPGRHPHIRGQGTATLTSYKTV